MATQVGDWLVDFSKVNEVRWNVMDPKRDAHNLSDKWYWCSFAEYGHDQKHILESGLVKTKAEALTKARRSARIWRAEHYLSKRGA